MQGNVRRIAVLMLVAGIGMCATVQASSSLWTGVDGGLSASALFEVSGGNLVVTLTNTSMNDVLIPDHVLTAVFFDVATAPALSPVSAVIGPMSTVLFGGTDPGGVVGGEWALAGSLSGAPGNAAYGISSAGFGLFGSPNFPGSNLQGPMGVNGLEYGITSAGDNPLTGNTPVTGTNALVKNQVIFNLGAVSGDFDPRTQIGNVLFQYGTGLHEPTIPGVPEPASLVLIAVGSLVSLVRRR